MKIFTAIKTAVLRSLRLWQGGLIVWFSSLVLISLLAVPVNGTLNSITGTSMITEQLADNIDVEVFADMGESFKSIISFLSAGTLMIIMAAFLLNAFLTGGLFHSLRGSAGRFSAIEFFGESARNFWSFLVITLIITLIIIIVTVLIIILPVSLAVNADQPADGAFFRTFMIVFPIWVILVSLLLLAADYARACQVSGKQKRYFKAIGFGFGMTFRTFWSSFPLMLIILAIQVLFGWFVFSLLSGMTPHKGGGVFLLFVLSQFLFLIRILLKICRYGSVTALMELNSASSEVPGTIQEVPVSNENDPVVN
jgi:hypothetical protein